MACIVFTEYNKMTDQVRSIWINKWKQLKFFNLLLISRQNFDLEINFKQPVILLILRNLTCIICLFRAKKITVLLNHQLIKYLAFLFIHKPAKLPMTLSKLWPRNHRLVNHEANCLILVFLSQLQLLYHLPQPFFKLKMQNALI